MKTNKEYNKNLSKGIITREMLEDCIFSCNKRAKKPFGCEILIEKNGKQKNIIVYVDEEKLSDFSEVRFEPSDDKDLICSVVNKKVRKVPQNIHCQV